MRSLSDAQIRQFLDEDGRTAKLATVAADGQPHVVPVWYIVDSDEVVVTMSSTTAKGRHLARDPRVALTVDDERPPFAFVTVRGVATLLHDPPDLLDWTTRIAARYVPPDDVARLGARFADIDDLVVRIRPIRAIGWAEVTA